MIDGEIVDPMGNYRVTVNSFMAEGGDRYSVLKEGAERVGGPLDLDAFVAYFDRLGEVNPGPQNRINRVN